MPLSKKYIAGLKANIKANSGNIPHQQQFEADEWDARFIRCSRRLLSAIVFREISHLSLEKTGSMLLPIIGFYYTLFHSGVAMLCIDHQTSLDELSHRRDSQEKKEPVTHRKVRDLIKSRLVNSSLLNNTFVSNFNHMKQVREHFNYRVGGKLAEDSKFEEIDAGKLYNQTGTSLAQAIELIKEIGAVADTNPERHLAGLSLLRASITDNFGDDLIDLHVPREHQQKIWDYLLAQDLVN